MPKTAEELKLLKDKVSALESELKELSEDELEKVVGGLMKNRKIEEYETVIDNQEPIQIACPPVESVVKLT